MGFSYFITAYILLLWCLNIRPVHIIKSVMLIRLLKTTLWININTTTSCIQTTNSQLFWVKNIDKTLSKSFTNLFVEVTLITEGNNILKKGDRINSLLTFELNIYITPVWLRSNTAIRFKKSAVIACSEIWNRILNYLKKLRCFLIYRKFYIFNRIYVLKSNKPINGVIILQNWNFSCSQHLCIREDLNINFNFEQLTKIGRSAFSNLLTHIICSFTKLGHIE